jgi:hypothetical protein
MSRLRKWKIWRYCVDNRKVYPMEIPEEQLITGKSGRLVLNATTAVSDIGSPGSSANLSWFPSHYTW